MKTKVIRLYGKEDLRLEEFKLHKFKGLWNMDTEEFLLKKAPEI